MTEMIEPRHHAYLCFPISQASWISMAVSVTSVLLPEALAVQLLQYVVVAVGSDMCNFLCCVVRLDMKATSEVAECMHMILGDGLVFDKAAA